MNFLSVCLPWILLVHNSFCCKIACTQEQYATKLNMVVCDWAEMLEKYNDIRLVKKDGCMEENVKMLSLLFDSYEVGDVHFSRRMVLQLIDSIVHVVNTSESLKPYLCQYPFTADNVQIRINFISRCKLPYYAMGQVAFASYIDGNMTYYGIAPCPINNLEKLRQEPLEFARSVIAMEPPLMSIDDPCQGYN